MVGGRCLPFLLGFGNFSAMLNFGWVSIPTEKCGDFRNGAMLGKPHGSTYTISRSGRGELVVEDWFLWVKIFHP